MPLFIVSEGAVSYNCCENWRCAGTVWIGRFGKWLVKWPVLLGEPDTGGRHQQLVHFWRFVLSFEFKLTSQKCLTRTQKKHHGLSALVRLALCVEILPSTVQNPTNAKQRKHSTTMFYRSFCLKKNQRKYLFFTNGKMSPLLDFFISNIFIGSKLWFWINEIQYLFLCAIFDFMFAPQRR